jgi:two-component system response regulator (stage 0 sporulation protein A)
MKLENYENYGIMINGKWCPIVHRDNVTSIIESDDDIALNLNERISSTLQKIGMTCNIKGYGYVRTAILMVYKDRYLLDRVTGSLYPNIAKLNNTTGSRVERAIRHAVETAWNKGNRIFVDSLFKGTVSYNKSKPTNSEFIALLADELKLGNI